MIKSFGTLCHIPETFLPLFAGGASHKGIFGMHGAEGLHR